MAKTTRAAAGAATEPDADPKTDPGADPQPDTGTDPEPGKEPEKGEPDPAPGSTGQSTAAAPVDAPVPHDPVLGRPDSSTNFVAAAAALRSPTGSAHIRLLDEDGNDVDPESVFTFPPPESPSALATVNLRVFEEFFYPEAKTPTTHLLYPAGRTVPVAEAVRVRDALRTAAAAVPA